jgi:hypothetical protein
MQILRARQIESSCSRLIVTVRLRRSIRKSLLRFAQNARSLLVSAFDLCKFVRKMRAICIIKKSDVVYFQVLLSFVPTIFHFFYFPALPFRWNLPANPLAWPAAGVRLRQCVHKMTTPIGYHAASGLSSKKCKQQKMQQQKMQKKPADAPESRRPVWPDHGHTVDSVEMSSNGARAA